MDLAVTEAMPCSHSIHLGGSSACDARHGMLNMIGYERLTHGASCH